MKTAIISALISLGLFYGIVVGNQYAMNAMMFLVVVGFILSVLVNIVFNHDTLGPETVDDLVKSGTYNTFTSKLNMDFNFYVGLALAIGLASMGWFVFATLEFLGTMLLHNAKGAAKTLHAKSVDSDNI